MATISVDDNNFEQDVLKSDKPVLVDFWAEWCGPCKMLAPVLDEVSEERDDLVKIAKMNVDENPHTPSKFGVRGLPTMMLFKNGEITATKLGPMAKGDLISWIEGELSA